jgi:membrane-bound ClpP family serine protease
VKKYNFGLLALLVLVLFSGSASAQADGAVKLAVFKGPVTPVLASDLDRAIADAEASGAAALVLQLDTPGGSVDAPRRSSV